MPPSDEKKRELLEQRSEEQRIAHALEQGSKEQRGSLALAMLDFQSKAPKLLRTGTNPHYRSKYVPLDELVAATLPILNECGIVVSQACSVADGEPALTTRLIHAQTGEAEEETMLIFPPKNDPQGQGSAITYARRYQLASMLCLVSDPDDDGNAGSPKSTFKPLPDTRKNGQQTGELVSEKQAKFIDWQLKRLDTYDREHGTKHGVDWRARMRKEFMTSDPALIPKSPNLRSFVDELKSLADNLEGDGA